MIVPQQSFRSWQEINDMMLMILAAALSQCNKAPSNLEMRRCTGRLLEKTDHEMATQWRLTLRKLRAEDLQNRRELANKPILAEGLLRSQRAWLRYRDAECAMISEQAAGGTAYGELGSRCAIALNQERRLQLKRRADQFLLP